MVKLAWRFAKVPNLGIGEAEQVDFEMRID